ncbi:peptidoglycan editing factor PgeF [Heliorestis acidaminivorans]|uniref:peptidoglycan editing factor PgeF n=1 Tax=Heliorestis acidaminivorans TaxID=553427 RepID=UPI0014798006|nr:peptidoglycan editing factor PgeF [Heliorestis acidaminivorans]
MQDLKWSRRCRGELAVYQPSWDSNVLSAVSTRQGGASSLPYDTLNLAYHVQDEAEKVEQNRERLTRALGLASAPWVTLNQVHGTKVHWVSKDNIKAFQGQNMNELVEGDALATEDSDLPLVVFGADCALLLYYDAIGGRIGAVHAGWRGTVAGLPSIMVEEFIERGSKVQNIQVAIGPAIGPCCYPVGTEVVNAFHQRWSFADQLFTSEEKECNEKSKNMVRFDLIKAIELQLMEYKLKPEHISTLNMCTSCAEEDFFSYRRDQGRTGRHGALIMLTRP